MKEWKYISDILSFSDIKRNTVLFGRRNIGKTHFLLDCFLKYATNYDRKIFVIDSATDHKEKSLLVKITNVGCDYIRINTPDEAENYEDLKQHWNKLSAKCDKNIVLIDAAKFLEESYEVEDAAERANLRKKYKLFVEQCIRFICESCNRFVLIMDEIELTNVAAAMLKNAGDKGFFIDAVHDISYIELVKNFNFINADRLLLFNNLGLKKNSLQLCGNACAEAAAALFYNKDAATRQKLFWCAEIALFLAEKMINVKLLFWKSRLYEDYKNKNMPCLNVFNALKTYEKKVGIIEERPLNYEFFRQEVIQSRCVIYCVDSAFFNNDKNLSGGHFIVVFFHEKNFYLINPKKNIIEFFECDVNHVVDSCVINGGWRILCG